MRALRWIGLVLTLLVAGIGLGTSRSSAAALPTAGALAAEAAPAAPLVGKAYYYRRHYRYRPYRRYYGYRPYRRYYYRPYYRRAYRPYYRRYYRPYYRPHYRRIYGPRFYF
jgi:hypothetical protein